MNESDFYKVTSIQNRESGWLITFTLYPGHRIFEGHFPGNPILPGVCMIQMVKDAVCNLTGKQWLLSEARQIKFLEMIVPEEKDEFTFLLQKDDNADLTLVQASFEKEGKVFFKFQGRFKHR